MEFLVACLATWRISNIIYEEKIFESVRARLGVFRDGSYNDTFIANLLSCFWCVSVWVGIACTIVTAVAPVVLLPFALSAAAIMIKGVVDG